MDDAALHDGGIHRTRRRRGRAWLHGLDLQEDGKTAETPKINFWRFKDGKAVEYYEYFDTNCVVEASR